MTWWFYSQNGGFISIEQKANFTDNEIIFDPLTENMRKLFEDKIENIDTFLKIPSSFLRYNLYLKSAVKVKYNNKILYSPIRVGVEKEYIEKKEPMESQPIIYFKKTLKNPNEITSTNFSVAFGRSPIPYKADIIGDTYTYGIFPTKLSLLIVFIACISIIHFFLFIIYKWYKFVRYFIF